MPPADGAFQGAADDVVDLPGGAGAERATDVAGAGASGAQFAAAMQPGVEALQELGVDLAGGHVPERRVDVQADQVVVALAGGVLELGDLEPLRDGLAHGDRGLRVLVLVDLALELRQRDLGCRPGVGGLADVPRLAGERVGASVDDGADRPAGELLDVPARAALTGRHGMRVQALIPRTIPRNAWVSPQQRVRAGQRGAPGRIRTCATASGGRCSIP